MARETKVEGIEKRIEICKEYASLWEEFFKCFGTGDLQERRIFDQDEVRFQKIITQLAHQKFRFVYYMGDKFTDGDKIIDVLERAENLHVLRDMADANFSKLEIDWHQVFIGMHRAVGRLMRELPLEEPEPEDDGKGKKKRGRGKRKGGTPSGTKAKPRVPTAPKPGAPAVPRLGVPKGPAGPPRPKGP
ncbi:hypothetical protein JXA47_12110 [Candidatus Sumerlaeota bacterium]|nr:hypothetical protein [Candidatus Sumerlaeota bacterium]